MTRHCPGQLLGKPAASHSHFRSFFATEIANNFFYVFFGVPIVWDDGALLCLPYTDIRRDNRPELKKAGNLRYAFARTSGELYAIFDADFCPRPDFLRETVPYFEAEPSIGILQTPQFFRRREEQTWVEQGAGSSQELFYRLIQVRLGGAGVRAKRSNGRCAGGLLLTRCAAP